MQVSGRTLEILSPEAVLADRLASWEFWNSEQDGINAFLVWRSAYETIDANKLGLLVEDRHLEAAWDRFTEFSERYLEKEPTPEELARWASRPSR